MDGPQDRSIYRPGIAEYYRARHLFYLGQLTEAGLVQAETLAASGRNRRAIRELHSLRGERCLARQEPALAVATFQESVRMAREVGRNDPVAEARLALARLRAGMSGDARAEAERLSKAPEELAFALAELWRELGDRDRAVEHALRAHRWAVADGEPYVRRYELDRTRALLAGLGADLPEVPRHDPAKTPPYPWEADVRAFIAKLRAEREAEAEEAKQAADAKATETAKRKAGKPKDCGAGRREAARREGGDP